MIDLSQVKDRILENIGNEIKTLEEAAIELKKSESFFEIIMSIRNLNKLLNSNTLLGLFYDESSDAFFQKAEVSVKNGYLRFTDSNYCVKFSLLDKYIEVSKSKRSNKPKILETEDYEKNHLILQDYELNGTKGSLVVSEYKKQDSIGFFDKIFVNKEKLELYIYELEESNKLYLIQLEVYEKMFKAYEENIIEDGKFLSSIKGDLGIFLENGWELDSYGIEI